MKMAVRGLAVSLLSCGILGGVSLAYPNWTAHCGVDVWNYGTYSRQLSDAEGQTGRIEREALAIAKRIAAKDALIQDLIEGRVELGGVIGEFMRLNDAYPSLDRVIRDYYPGHSDAERTARNVLHFVDQRLEEKSGRRAEVMGRLRAEFDRLLAEAQ